MDSFADDDRIVERFDAESSLASSTESLAGARCIENMHQVVLSRNLFGSIRGVRPRDDGGGMPAFTVVSITGSDPMTEPAPSPREPGIVVPLVRGDGRHTDEVWHTICTGYTLMPGVCAEFGDSVVCNFCAHKGLLGTPVVVMRHVCTPDGSEQRVQLLVARACGKCASKRCTVAPPLRRYTALFIQEQVTRHVKYILEAARHKLSVLRVSVFDEAAACDACYVPVDMASGDYVAVIAQRVDKSEHAILIACSDKCRDQVSENVWRSDIMSKQWTVLGPGETMAALESTAPGSLMGRGRDIVLHACKEQHCFCHGTHRGGFARSVGQRATVLSSSTTNVSADTVLRIVYTGLTAVYLYVDLLGGDSVTRCAHCKKPAGTVCNVCWAVRTCSRECRAAFASEHSRLCRPYSGAWSPFVTL